MTSVLWIYNELDPLNSGELRRLGAPALALDNKVWASALCPSLAASAVAKAQPPADVAVVTLSAADVLPTLAAGTRVVVEVDTGTSLLHPDASAILRGLSNRIAGVAARGVRAAGWANRILEGAAPVWLVPDPALRGVEMSAAAIELGLPQPEGLLPDLDRGLDLWFCEPGDHIDEVEIEALARLWRHEDPSRLLVAPSLVRAWAAQAGVRAASLTWSPMILQHALSRATRCNFLGPENYVQARRRVLALRSGASCAPPRSPSPTLFEPMQVAAGWEHILSTVIETAADPRPAAREPARVMVFIDLIQDLDPLLPVLDELRGRAEVELKVVCTSWVLRHSPRIAAELEARSLVYETCERPAVATGTQPSLFRIDAVVVAAESSLQAHLRSHTLVNAARAAGIATFAFQHGVENVGLHHVPGEEDATVSADYLFVWFPAKGVSGTIAAALRPRLLHVGRVLAPHPDLADLNGTFAAFESVVVVFENLHWSRYDHDWRLRFLTDCAEFAFASPDRAVILKPHHAGLWSVKNRHLIPQWPSNLIVADPTDAFWEPYTAAALVQLADVVITTPSTVALDAVQAGKPVAVAAYGLPLPAYAPLPIIQRFEDWLGFCEAAGNAEDARRRAIFLLRTADGERAAAGTADYITAVAFNRRRSRRSTRQAERMEA